MENYLFKNNKNGVGNEGPASPDIDSVIHDFRPSKIIVDFS